MEVCIKGSTTKVDKNASKKGGPFSIRKEDDIVCSVQKYIELVQRTNETRKIEGAQKAVKMYDTLMKAGNFTAVQNKTDKGEFINSISELVSICEREGFIPRYYIEQPNDKVDETIADNKAYVRSLVMGEMNLGNLIENAVKAMADQEAQEEFKDEDEEPNFDDIEKEFVVLDDKDFQEVQSFIDSEHDADKELLKQFEEEV